MQELLQELIKGQKKKLMRCAEAIVPHITEEDVLQPNDFPELENNPTFRYEEGVLEGLYTALMAYRAQKREMELIQASS